MNLAGLTKGQSIFIMISFTASLLLAVAGIPIMKMVNLKTGMIMTFVGVGLLLIVSLIWVVTITINRKK